ncbi:MAG: hypothetical protein HYY04_10175 [Chloroflexi bacterium]|nr:hypothetical protein [Chloroflexota bacterium]
MSSTSLPAEGAPPSTIRAVVLLLVAALLVRGLLYAALTPPWQAPDEPRHFEYLRLLADQRRLISIEDAALPLQRQILDSMLAHEYFKYLGRPTPSIPPPSFQALWGPQATLLHRAPLYYVALAPVAWATGSWPLVDQLLLLRVLDVGLLVLTGLVVYAAARTLFPDRPSIALGALAFAAFLPQLAQIGGSLNSDNLVNLLGALFFLGILRSARPELRLRWFLFACVVLLVGLTAKRGLLVLGALLPLALILAPLHQRASGGWLVALAPVALLAAAGVWLLRPGSAAGTLVQRYLTDAGYENLLQLLGPARRTPEALALYQLALDTLFKSFWGMFGWMAIRLGDTAYLVLLVATGVAALGTLVVLARGLAGRNDLAGWQASELVLAWVAVALVTASALGYSALYLRADVLPQGRYLYLALAPAAILFATGAEQVLRPVLGPRYLVVYVLALAGGDLLAITTTMLPAFHG